MPRQDGNEDGQGQHDFVPAPGAMFVCPNGHEMLVALHVEGIDDKMNGDYCWACYMQFITQHTPRVQTEKFED